MRIFCGRRSAILLTPRGSKAVQDFWGMPLDEFIRAVLSNLHAVLFAAAIVITLLRGAPIAGRLLEWLLLLPIGVGYSWAGFFHVFFPEMAAQSIGWQVSPFQFEIGVADMSIGLLAILSFWRPLPFKTAVALYIVLFSVGVTVGHVRQALAGDFASNNFGLLLALTVAEIVLFPILLLLVRREGAAKS